MLAKWWERLLEEAQTSSFTNRNTNRFRRMEVETTGKGVGAILCL